MIQSHTSGIFLVTELTMHPVSLITPWQGFLDLRYSEQDGQTQMSYAQAQAPFKIQRPFYPEGSGVCHSVILHTAGGLVGGDRLDLQVSLAPGSHALVTTAAATKIYRSNGLTAVQKAHIKLEAGACLEWFPQEAIAFQGSDYFQQMRIDLEPGAVVLLWDIMRFGRSAAGEQFLQGQVRSQIEVWQQGKPLWIDRQRLVGDPIVLQSPNAFANYPVLGSFACLGLDISLDLLQQLRDIAFADSHGERGLTRLQSGLLCRYRGSSSLQARQWFIHLWNRVRLTTYHRAACVPKVWPS